MYGNYILACLPCLEPTMAFMPPLLKKLYIALNSTNGFIVMAAN